MHIRVQWVSHQGAQISAKLQVREFSAWKFDKVRGPLPGQVLSAKHILFQVILMAFREAVFIRAPGKKPEIASRKFGNDVTMIAF